VSESKYDIEQNDWAEDINGKSIYILNAESGAKGYYCPGCGNEMQAVRTKIVNRKSYFRHHATDVSIERQCTFSNETYRHKISKEILQRLMQIKLPKVIIGPADKNSQTPNYILEYERILSAKKVRNEVSFYEKEDGNIAWSQNQAHGKDLLIRADTAFFDENDEPILLIEFKATHGIDPEKQAKIRYLGIDAIEVKVPKGSLEDLEQNLKITKNIKWLFNNLIENTDYETIHTGTEESFSQTNEDQGRVFEETFGCRSAELRNLIRSINRTIESPSYRAEEDRIGRDLQRVKKNAEAAKRKWEELQESIDQLFEQPRSELSKRQTALRVRHKELEKRYNRKRAELADEERKIEDEIKDREWIERRTKEEFKEFKEQLEGDIEYERIQIDRIEEEERSLSEGLTEKIFRDEEIIKNQIKSTEERIIEVEREQNIIRKSEKISRVEFEEARTRIEGTTKERENQIRRDDRDLQRRIAKSIQEGYRIGEFSMSKRMAGLFEARRILGTFKERRDALERTRRAWESFRSGAYKNWYQKR